MRPRSPVVLVPVVLVLAALAPALAGCGDEGAESAVDPAPTTASAEAVSGTCQYPPDGAGAARPVEPPPTEPAAAGSVPVRIRTSAGLLTARLDADGTPCTVNSFLSLTEQGYFDETRCHRLTTDGIYVLQCGDPTATGMGGPGYSFPDELSGSETYPAGTLAMANAGADTNGSQFFFVYRDTVLRPAYAVFGRLDTASIRVLQRVAAKGTADGGGDGEPAKPVTLESVTPR